jgi:hypothetical protein
MNLGQYKDFTAAKIGLSDTITKTQAGEFAKARWRMIWSAAMFRQTRIYDTVSVAAGVQEVTLPEFFELVHACRWNGDRLLTPMLDLAALARNPAGFDTIGNVAAFIPLARSDDGRARIRLNQIPEKAGVLFVIGKRTCVELVNDFDVPLIPGVDNCLIAFVMGDLYQWMRQFTKAETFFREANALLQTMIDIETAQSAEIRQIIPDVQQLEGEW